MIRAIRQADGELAAERVIRQSTVESDDLFDWIDCRSDLARHLLRFGVAGSEDDQTHVAAKAELDQDALSSFHRSSTGGLSTGEKNPVNGKGFTTCVRVAVLEMYPFMGGAERYRGRPNI